MSRSPLFGRRIHIAGAVAIDETIAGAEEVDRTRDLVQGLVHELVKRGATFVVPVDAEPLRPHDQRPICFDWLVWRTLHSSLSQRPANAPNPFVTAVQHHKTEEQIPEECQGLWDELRGSDLVQIENVSHWNMNSKRMEAQARYGDILLTIGGSEGVLFLANLYHEAGKPVVPLSCPVTSPDAGALRLFTFGLSSANAPRLFRTVETSAHTWINRTNFSKRTPLAARVETIIGLLESLEPPHAFVVRLLDPSHPDFADVEEFFASVVQPIVEGEMGYRLLVVDGQQAYEHPRIDEEIFTKLHHSGVVVADITGLRPNCFVEFGYALGRGLPVILTIREGEKHPFDLVTFAAHHWQATASIAERRRAFRDHWNAIQARPRLVPSEPLIP